MKRQLVFSKLTADDVPQIMAIENQIYPNPWSEKLMQECLTAGYQCIKGTDPEDSKHILCYAILMIGYQESNLLNIGTHPQFQQQGLASQLLKHLLLISRINQAKQMWLEVRESNQAAKALYERFEFKTVGLRKNYYQYQDANGQKIKEHAILMAKKIMS